MIAQNEIDVSRDIAIYHFIVGCRIEGLCSARKSRAIKGTEVPSDC